MAHVTKNLLRLSSALGETELLPTGGSEGMSAWSCPWTPCHLAMSRANRKQRSMPKGGRPHLHDTELQKFKL